MTDGEDWFKTVESRFTNEFEIAKGFMDLTMHAVDVFGDVSTAVSDFKNHRNYYEAG